MKPTTMTRKGQLFQHIQHFETDAEGKVKTHATTSKSHAGNTYYLGLLGPVDRCFPQWVRADRLELS